MDSDPSSGHDHIEVRPDFGVKDWDGWVVAQGEQRSLSPRSPLFAAIVPLPLAPRSRIAWRLGLLVLCLNQCRAYSATVEQLHILTWALQGADNYNELTRYWSGSVPGRKLRVWNAELDDTLRVAIAGDLVELTSSGRQKLTALGARLAKELSSKRSEAFEVERRQLSELGRISTTGMMRRLNEVGVGEVSGE